MPYDKQPINKSKGVIVYKFDDLGRFDLIRGNGEYRKIPPR
jgi:hypothetical protein